MSAGAHPLRRASLLLAAGTLASAVRSAEPSCFDLAQGFDAPLRPPIELREGSDHAEFGSYADGRDWASVRAVVAMPLAKVHAKLLDPRNLKDMKKTRIVVRPLPQAGYLDVRELDIEVTGRALLVKVTVRWTERWAFRLLEGTPEQPLLIVANYQKVAGTEHIRHQCGSYVLRPLGAGASDLSLYEEIAAKRRSARDTRDMLLGNLRSIREDRWDADRLSEDARVKLEGAPP
jgi:hypothetical protein